MWYISVTASVFHEEMSWLNEDALLNMLSVRVHDEEMSWLNEDACRNMLFISITFAVFHEETSWLNEDAPLNMAYIYITFAVFHEEMSWLNEDAPLNMSPTDVPCGKILVEIARPLKDGVHIRHRGDVPVGNIGVEITFPVEYIFHIVDSGHVPRSNGDVVRVFAARSRGVGTKTAACSESGSQSSFRVERGLPLLTYDRACVERRIRCMRRRNLGYQPHEFFSRVCASSSRASTSSSFVALTVPWSESDACTRLLLRRTV